MVNDQSKRMEPSLAFEAAIFITSLITRFKQEVTLLSEYTDACKAMLHLILPLFYWTVG